MTSVMWQPSATDSQDSHIMHFLHECNQRYQLNLQNYYDLYAWSVAHLDAFWQMVWDFAHVQAFSPPLKIVQDMDKMPGARWFVGATLNYAQNLLRYKDDQLALVFNNEKNVEQTYTHAQLYTAVAQLAAGLKAAGVKKGDRVVGFLPNIPHAIIGLLASASIGAIWSSCSPDLGCRACWIDLVKLHPKYY